MTQTDKGVSFSHLISEHWELWLHEPQYVHLNGEKEHLRKTKVAAGCLRKTLCVHQMQLLSNVPAEC